MRWRVCSIGSTNLYLHAAVVPFAMYMLLMGYGEIFFVGGISVLVHECAHALIAYLMGTPPAEIELSPLGAVMRLEDEEQLPPLRRLVMLMAGPGASLALCLAALFLTRCGVLSAAGGRTLFLCNLALAMLNLLPALPLDGGRILCLFLSAFLQAELARRIVRIISTVLGLGLIAANVLYTLRFGGWNLTLAASGCVMVYAASASTTTLALQELRRLMDRKIRMEQHGVVACRWLTATELCSLRRVVCRLHPRHYTMLHLLESGTMRPLACVGEERLIAAYLQHPHQNCRVLLEPCQRI